MSQTRQLAELDWLYYKTGNIAEAKKNSDELILRSKTDFISGLSLFVAAYSLKKYDQAYEFFERAFGKKGILLVTIELYLFFSFVKTDQRFYLIIKRMNF